MEQYRHKDFSFKPVKETTREELEEQVKKLTQQVAQLSERVEFLLRQDQRSRSSFETIQARINARK